MNKVIYCSFCHNIIDSNDFQLIRKPKFSVENTSYLCQDCLLNAAIYVEDFMKKEISPNITNQKKLISCISSFSNSKRKDEIERIFTTNAIVVEGDVTKPKILLNHSKKEVFEQVTKKVRYQDKAIKQVIRTIYSNLCIEDSTFKDNMLLIGDTGVGKTFSVTNILEYWGIPYAIVDCNEYSETGYVGKDVVDAVKKLYNSCGKNSELASRGVIIFDEFDKIRAGEISSRDVSGESVQEEMLALLTGKKVEVTPTTYVDTSFITFILLGAFDSTVKSGKLSEIRKKRIETANGTRSLGFNTTSEGNLKHVISSYTAEDLNSYGIISQLTGRTTVIIEYNKFNAQMCYDILFNSKSSKLIHIYQKFNMLGVNLLIDSLAKEEICNYITQIGTGARGISSFLNEIFSPALEKIEDDLDFENIKYESCIISKETIIDHSHFTLVQKNVNYATANA